MRKDTLLNKFRERIASDPFFFASALEIYRCAHDMSDTQLAERLGGTVEDVGRLALCRLPNDESDQFLAEVAQISAFAGLEFHELLRVVREVQVLQSLQDTSKIEQSDLLMAARDKKEDPGEDDGTK